MPFLQRAPLLRSKTIEYTAIHKRCDAYVRVPEIIAVEVRGLAEFFGQPGEDRVSLMSNLGCEVFEESAGCAPGPGDFAVGPVDGFVSIIT